MELVTLIRKNDVEFMHLIEFAEEVVASLDINGDDQITREEFTEALRKDAMVLDIFAQCTAISVSPCVVLAGFVRVGVRVARVRVAHTVVVCWSSLCQKDKLKACHTLKRDHTEHTLTFETLLAYVRRVSSLRWWTPPHGVWAGPWACLGCRIPGMWTAQAPSASC